jgi:hypothetical protein
VDYSSEEAVYPSTAKHHILFVFVRVQFMVHIEPQSTPPKIFEPAKVMRGNGPDVIRRYAQNLG